MGIHLVLKVLPELTIDWWIRMANPNTNNIINEASVKEEIWFEFIEEGVLMNCKVKVGVRWCRWCAHRGTTCLLPHSVSKPKDVVSHDNAKALNDSFSCFDGVIAPVRP